MTDPTPLAHELPPWEERLPADVRERLESEGRLEEASVVSDDALVAEEVRKQQEANRRAWWEKAVPADYVEADLDKLPLDTEHNVIRAWLAGSTTNLLLAGTAGTGKTYAAYAVLRAASRRGQWTWATTAGDHVAYSAFSGGQPRMVERACRADVLLLDDLGAERTTDFAIEAIGNLVDERRREHRRTIITTNLGRDELVRRYGDRLVSRLGGGASIVVLTGPDRRIGQQW